MTTGRCIHCLAPLTAPAEVCKSCVDLLDDLGEYDDDYEPEPPPPPPPPPRPRPRRTGRYEPTPQEIAEYEELSARGSFRPFNDVRAKEPPGHTRGRWGRAIEAEKRSRRDPDVPKQ